MTIRLAVISGGKIANAVFAKLAAKSSGKVEIALDLGKKQSNFVATSLSRMTPRSARSGHLMDGSTYAGAADALFQSPDYFRLRDEFTDHMTRTSDSAKLKSHPLRNVADYHAYYHILCDALATEVRQRGVTHVVFTNIPHLGYDTALHHVARALGLPIVILSQSLFADRLFSMTDPACFGLFDARQLAKPHSIARDETAEWFYMKGIGQESGKTGRVSAAALTELAFFLLRKRPLQALNPLYVARLVSRMRRIYRGLPDWRDPFAHFFHEESLAYFEHLCELENQETDLSGDFVYFPLQMQPEMTTSALGGRFLDQAYAIERLAAMLPKGVRILVKENPKQGAYMRGPLFFHRLRRIPAVQFLPASANTHALTAKARFIATVTGTAGWEAICQGKPALVFGQAWYRRLPGVVTYRGGLTYGDVANQIWDHAALERAAGALLARCHQGVIDPSYTQICTNFDAEKNAETVAALIIGLLQGTIAPSFGAHAAVPYPHTRVMKKTPLPGPLNAPARHDLKDRGHPQGAVDEGPKTKKVIPRV